MELLDTPPSLPYTMAIKVAKMRTLIVRISSLNVVMLGTFGMSPKSTMRARALPMGKALVKRGHSVRIVVPPWDNLTDSGVHRIEEGIPIYNITIPRSLHSAAIPIALLKETLRHAPDVVHVFKPKGYGGLTALLLQCLRKKVVVDSDDWEGRGGWNQLNRYSPAQRMFFDFQERSIPRFSGVVTVASRTLEAQMWAFGLEPQRVFYVPNGVAHHKYDPWVADPSVRMVRQRHKLNDNPVILLYTRFVEFQVDRLVEILRAVTEKNPQIRLLVVGQGFFGEEKELRRRADNLGLGDHVVTAGWVDRRELPAYLYTADVAIVPFDDTLVNRAKCSVKLLELMVTGRAIVADRVGQNAEYLRHLDSGLLVEPGAPHSFAREILRLLEDEDLRRSLGEKAREDVWDRFDWEHLVEKVEEAYRLC